MRRMVVRYRTKPGQAQENRRLVEAVFAELKAKSPPGVRYMVLQVGDDDFVHFVESGGGASPLPGLDAFRQFQAGIKERCAEGPQAGEASIVGNYRMLAE